MRASTWCGFCARKQAWPTTTSVSWLIYAPALQALDAADALVDAAAVLAAADPGGNRSSNASVAPAASAGNATANDVTEAELLDEALKVGAAGEGERSVAVYASR